MIFIGFISRILFGIIFLIAAVRKAGNITVFAQTIYMIGFKEKLSRGISWLIVVYEAILGVLFLLGAFPFLAILLALMLLILFITVSIRAMLLHQKVRCNCFGRSESLLGAYTLRQATLLLLPVGSYYLSTFFGTSPWWPTSPEMIISSLSLVAGLLLLARWLLMAQAIVNLARSRQQSDKAMVDIRTQRELLRNA